MNKCGAKGQSNQAQKSLIRLWNIITLGRLESNVPQKTGSSARRVRGQDSGDPRRPEEK